MIAQYRQEKTSEYNNIVKLIAVGAYTCDVLTRGHQKFALLRRRKLSIIEEESKQHGAEQELLHEIKTDK